MRRVYNSDPEAKSLLWCLVEQEFTVRLPVTWSFFIASSPTLGYAFHLLGPAPMCRRVRPYQVERHHSTICPAVAGLLRRNR